MKNPARPTAPLSGIRYTRLSWFERLGSLCVLGFWVLAGLALILNGRASDHRTVALCFAWIALAYFLLGLILPVACGIIDVWLGPRRPARRAIKKPPAPGPPSPGVWDLELDG
jgi:hypothetical protein